MGCCGDSNAVEAVSTPPAPEDEADRKRRRDSQDGKYGDPREHDPGFEGPIKDRSCTDCLCALLFVVFLGGWIAVAVYGFINGNPLRVIHPSDSYGDICGAGKYENKPYVLFFDLTKCIRADVIISGCPTKQVCVEKCPEENSFPWKDALDLDEDDQQAMKKEMAKYCGPRLTEERLDDKSVTVRDLISAHICPPWLLPSKQLLGRCVPTFGIGSGSDDDATTRAALSNDTVLVDKSSTPEASDLTVKTLKDAVNSLGKLIDVQDLWQRFYSDLSQIWWMVLLGLLLSLLLSLLWIVLMRYIAFVMVWMSIVLTILLLIGAGVYSFYKYDELLDQPEKTAGEEKALYFNEGAVSATVTSYVEAPSTWMTLFVVDCVVLLVLLILLLVLRTRIRIAIELIEESSIAVGDMMATLFFPVVPFVLDIFVMGWFILVTLYLISAAEQTFYVNTEDCSDAGTKAIMDKHGGNYKCEADKLPADIAETCPDATCDFYKYGTTYTAQWLFVYNLFGFLWVSFFVSAFEEMVMAGAFASWYFTRDKSKLSKVPLLRSVARTLRYHVGTLAFGALLIAVVRFIRLVVEYIEQKLKDVRQDTPLVKAVLCMCKCCLYCLEKFMRFINRNAYIVCAIYGNNFCSSAKDAFCLLMRNILRVAVLNSVTDVLLFVGKLLIVILMGAASFYFFSGRFDLGANLELNYYFMPVILVVLGTYFIADVFFSVYEMAIDTIFLCFLEDSERNDGSPEKPYFMSKDLKKILGKLKEEAEDVSNPPSRPPSP